MPCTACGNKGINVGFKKPSAMILGQQRQQTVRKPFVQRPTGLRLNVSRKTKTFLLGRK